MNSANQLDRQTNSFLRESAGIAAKQVTEADSYRLARWRIADRWRFGILRWAVVDVWAAVILGLGTSYFSLVRTAPVIEPAIRWLIPGATPEAIYYWHVMIRWSAHFSEYAVLFAALTLGPMRRRPLAALLVCIACASLDEGLQSLRPARSALICDVALDSSGAAAALVLALPRWISMLA